MSPKEFWHCSPRKFAALCEVHSEVNNPKKNKKKTMTIDGVPVENVPKTSRHSPGGVGAPDTFIDQINWLK